VLPAVGIYIANLGDIRDLAKQSQKVETAGLEEARAEAAKFMRLRPSFTISGWGAGLSAFKDPRDDKHPFDALRLVGLPE